MQLSYRLNTIASFITPGYRLADIGTDHGYVPIYLLENKIIPSAIAMDINKGPLNKAQENIVRANLQNNITTRLSDGLANLNEGEADCILIAGMGGNLITRILGEKISLIKSVKELVLSPHSEVENVRKFLADQGFAIIKEEMIKDDGKFYVILKAVLENNQYPEEIHMIYGELLLKSKNPILYEFLTQEMLKTESILKKLMENNTKKTEQRSEELKIKAEFIQRALEYYH